MLIHCYVMLLYDTVQFRKRTLHLQELYSSSKAKPKLAKMLREEIMCVAFCSVNRLAFPRSDYASLSFIALMFTTLHSIVAFQSAQPYYQMILCNFVNGRLICKSCIVHLRQNQNSENAKRTNYDFCILLSQPACFSSL